MPKSFTFRGLVSVLLMAAIIVIVEEDPPRDGVGAEIAATLAVAMSDYLTAPVARVASPNIPVPFSPPMENFYRPDAERIATGVQRTVGVS